MTYSILDSVDAIVNARLCQWLDERISSSDKGHVHSHIILEVFQWVNDVLHRTEIESEKWLQFCEVCLCPVDKKTSQRHHLAGRKHYFTTITACNPCHDQLTIDQKLWDRRWRKNGLSIELTSAFFLEGIHDALMLKATKTGDSDYRPLANLLVYDISTLLDCD